jgi:hypothetical protein
MNQEQAGDFLRKLFAKAGRANEKYRTEELQFDYLSRDGAQRFKRKALGLCGYSTLKSIDEVANILVETGIVPSTDEGRKIIPEIVQASQLAPHAILRKDICSYLSFEQVQNKHGDTRYKIVAFNGD